MAREKCPYCGEPKNSANLYSVPVHGVICGQCYKEIIKSERMYIVEGVDPSGNTFRGIYDEETARYLVAADCLNKILDDSNLQVVK